MHICDVAYMYGNNPQNQLCVCGFEVWEDGLDLEQEFMVPMHVSLGCAFVLSLSC